MKKLLCLFIFLCVGAAKVEISTWTQPTRNHASQAAIGVTCVWGPEIESGSGITAQQWCDSAKAMSLHVITKNQTAPVPTNCVGFYHPQDEPNSTGAKHVDPIKLKPEYDRLKLLAPNLPVFISLAGDKIADPNGIRPQDVQMYLDYAAVCDAVTVNFYSANRSNKYPMRMTAIAVKNWLDLCKANGLNKPIYAWIECNDQELSPPAPPETNREPTPQEMSDTVDAALIAGASGVGWFGVCSRAKHGWPENYWPMTNRNGVSMQPQYDMCKSIAERLNPQLTTEQRLKALEDWRATFFKF